MTTSSDEASSPTPAGALHRVPVDGRPPMTKPRRWLKDATAAPIQRAELPPPPAPAAPAATLPPPPAGGVSRRWFKATSPPWVAAGVFAALAITAGVFMGLQHLSGNPACDPACASSPNDLGQQGLPSPSPTPSLPSPTTPSIPTGSPSPPTGGLGLPSLPLP